MDRSGCRIKRNGKKDEAGKTKTKENEKKKEIRE